MLVETYEEVVVQFLNDQPGDLVSQWITGEDIFEDKEVFNTLLNFFIDKGTMPIGVAKARDGDPVDWMDAEICRCLSICGRIIA